MLDGENTEWFTSATEIAGVTWQPLVPVTIDPRLAGAQPRRSEEPWVPEGRYEWVDVAGEPLERFSWSSPCAGIAEEIYNAPHATSVYETFCRAVAHPGTRSDYLETVRFALGHMGISGPADGRCGEWLLDICEAGMQLVEADPDLARSADRRTSQNAEFLVREPFTTAIRLWQMNGYLREASEVEAREVAALGQYAGPRTDASSAEEVLAALSELRR